MVQLRKERNRSFGSECPKGRNRKERCSSGSNDPARPTAARDRPVSLAGLATQIRSLFSNRSFKMILFRVQVKTQESFLMSAFARQPSRPSSVYSNCQWGRACTFLGTAHVAPGPSCCAASAQPGASLICVCRCHSHVARLLAGKAGDRFPVDTCPAPVARRSKPPARGAEPSGSDAEG